MSDQPKGPPRVWLIKGGLGLRERPGGPPGNYPKAFCDGPVPDINEQVPVIEHSAFTDLLAQANALSHAIGQMKKRIPEDLGRPHQLGNEALKDFSEFKQKAGLG